jgi:glutathione S-transferase
MSISGEIMKLYDGGRAPNPRRVRVFLAEKGISVPVEAVDMAALQHRGPEFTQINPMQRLPVLELDDGTRIAESVAICRYFEALQPDPPLFGRGALEVARIEMWNRQVELDLQIAIAAAFRHLHPAMKGVEDPQVPEWGEANKPRVLKMLRFLDGELAGRPFIAGDTFSIADISAMISVDFMKWAKLSVPEELGHVRRWYANVAARPSASA